MNNYNEYNNEVYNDIKAEFGVEATSAHYAKPALPITIAQAIVWRYPNKAKQLVIAKRYLSLVMGVK